MAVDTGLASYLKSSTLKTSALATGVAWGTRAVTIEQQSALDLKADAVAQAAVTLAFVGGPLVKERVVVKGRRRDLLLRAVALTGTRLGYTATAIAAFVIGVAEQGNGTTLLTVVRKAKDSAAYSPPNLAVDPPPAPTVDNVYANTTLHYAGDEEFYSRLALIEREITALGG